MGKFVYLNNFPREKAEKGQEFKGNSDLQEELLERGIIGDGKVTKEVVDTSVLEAELEVAQAEIVRLNGLVKEAIGLAKGTAPEGFEG